MPIIITHIFALVIPFVKGRKIRYDVHDKLVHFMAPDESVHTSTDQARDDLFRSLFQDA